MMPCRKRVAKLVRELSPYSTSMPCCSLVHDSPFTLEERSSQRDIPHRNPHHADLDQPPGLAGLARLNSTATLKTLLCSRITNSKKFVQVHDQRQNGGVHTSNYTIMRKHLAAVNHATGSQDFHRRVFERALCARSSFTSPQFDSVPGLPRKWRGV